MTHPTADTTTTAIARDSEATLTVDWHECKYLPGKIAARIRPGSAFRNGMTNCLELRDADFHYFVIGRSGTAALVSGYADCRSFNNEVATSRSRDDWPRCHDVGWHYMTPQPIEPAMGFEPAEERTMQKTAVLITICKSM